MLEKRIQRYITEQKLFTMSDRLLVALSGGADSVALLRILLSLGYTCEAAHCNFHLRGAESDRDENFVRQLCSQLRVKLHVVHFDTRAHAYNNKVSIEMAARTLRYDWFEELRLSRGFQYVAVAHHRDDSVETFLLNLVRGTGIHGLKGISSKHGTIVRPLLKATRSQLLSYLENLHQSYVTDSTNLQDDYQRNKIRLRVLPLLQTLNPSIQHSISETADHLLETAKVYDAAIRQSVKRIEEAPVDEIRRFSIPSLLSEVSPQSILFEVMHPLGFTNSQLTEILLCLENEQSGKTFLAPGWKLVRDRNYLLLSPSKIQQLPQLECEVVERTSTFVIPRSRNVACLDADKVTAPLEIRLWQLGDWFIPFGMTGRKRISDYLTDRKFSLLAKERQCVVSSGGDIVWVVNERSDNRFRVTDKTRRIMLLHVHNK